MCINETAFRQSPSEELVQHNSVLEWGAVLQEVSFIYVLKKNPGMLSCNQIKGILGQILQLFEQ